MKLLTLFEATARLSMANAITIVREIETGRGGIAELVEKKPALKEMSQEKLRSEYGDVVPLFRVISIPEGKEMRDEGIVSTSTDWKVAYYMGSNQPGVVMTRDSFLTIKSVLLRYDTPVEQCLADVNMLLEMVLDSLGGYEKIGGQRIKGRRSGDGIEVSHVIQEGLKEDEVIADVSGIEPVVLEFDRKKEMDMVRGMGAGEFDSPDEYMQHRIDTKGTNEFFPPEEEEQMRAMYARRAPDVKKFLGIAEGQIVPTNNLPAKLYHGTTVSNVMEMLQDNVLNAGIHHGKPNEPDGPRLTKSYKVAQSFPPYSSYPKAVLEFSTARLASSYELVGYDDGIGSVNEQEVVALTKSIEPLDKYVSVIHITRDDMAALRHHGDEELEQMIGNLWSHPLVDIS